MEGDEYLPVGLDGSESTISSTLRKVDFRKLTKSTDLQALYMRTKGYIKRRKRDKKRETPFLIPLSIYGRKFIVDYLDLGQ